MSFGWTEVFHDLGKVHQSSGYGVQAPGGHLLGTVGVDDHRAGAQLAYHAGVLGVDPQLGSRMSEAWKHSTASSELAINRRS